MGSRIQQYCLRWNNHRSNLLLVFEHLFQTESFTDVTLACDGSSVKCHKIVLAAGSSYFQQLFMVNDCRHPIVILKDIKGSEIKAILEYMYKGEVNVAQDELAGLLKAAETLKVKGLVEDNHGNNVNTPTPTPTQTPPNQSPYQHPQQGHYAVSSSVSSSTEFHSISSNRNANNATNYSSKSNSNSKYGANDAVYDAPYNASSYPDKNSIPFHLWPSSKLPLPLSPSPKHGSNSRDSYENSQNEPVPLKKKKFMGATGKDTPILRTVLGHTATALQQHNCIDSQQQAHFQVQPGNTPYKNFHYNLPISSNGPIDHNDKGGQEMRQDSPDHYMDDSIRSVESDKVHEENSSFSIDEDNKSGIATYVPGQKPEWKRYKQYTRNDIMAAIEAVKGGMSALQAARKYGVPSRTLYDKVKKLGITRNRPYRKGSFPMSPYQGLNIKEEDGVVNYHMKQHNDDNNSNYSPEDQHTPLELSLSRNNGNGNGGGDSDKMDSDAGSGSVNYVMKVCSDDNMNDHDNSNYSPEDRDRDRDIRDRDIRDRDRDRDRRDRDRDHLEPLDISISGNNGGVGGGVGSGGPVNGIEGDSDKMDSDPGSVQC